MSADNTVAIIQARMGSTRLPGKVLKPLAGKPALWHVVNRLAYSKWLTAIVIATTGNREDNHIVDFCKKYDIRWFRGSSEDVLDRYYRAAKEYDADAVVRITSDCPVIDPFIVDEVIEGFYRGEYDVYGLGGEFPDGLDCGIYSFAALEKAWKVTTLPSDREHVGATYFTDNPDRLRIGSYEKFKGLGHLRWTLDEENDYRLLQIFYERLFRPGRIFLTDDILRLLEEEPELSGINSEIIRNEGYLKSLREDEEFRGKQNSGDVHD